MARSTSDLRADIDIAGVLEHMEHDLMIEGIEDYLSDMLGNELGTFTPLRVRYRRLS